MERCHQSLLLLWLTAVVAINILGSKTAGIEDDKLENPCNCSSLLRSNIGEVKAAGVTIEKQAGSDLQPSGSSTMLLTTLTSSQNHNINEDQTPVLGNTWKFTACVAALALSITMLIVCAIKGPSLYNVFHNYRHRRLHQEEEEEEDVV